jgi:hypothetical protein
MQPSLLVIGTPSFVNALIFPSQDPLVSEASSRTLAAVFVNPTVVLHSQGQS